MGRYDRAVKHLVKDVLRETENPVENLVQALEEMTSTESSQRAAQAIQKGDYYFKSCIHIATCTCTRLLLVNLLLMMFIHGSIRNSTCFPIHSCSFC